MAPTRWLEYRNVLGRQNGEYRIYALCDDVEGLRRSRPDLFSPPQTQLLGELILAGKEGKRARRFEWAMATRGRRDSVFQFGQ